MLRHAPWPGSKAAPILSRMIAYSDVAGRYVASADGPRWYQSGVTGWGGAARGGAGLPPPAAPTPYLVFILKG